MTTPCQQKEVNPFLDPPDPPPERMKKSTSLQGFQYFAENEEPRLRHKMISASVEDFHDHSFMTKNGISSKSGERFDFSIFPREKSGSFRKPRAELSVKFHHLSSVFFKTPTWCKHCNNFIFGFQKMSWECQGLNFFFSFFFSQKNYFELLFSSSQKFHFFFFFFKKGCGIKVHDKCVHNIRFTCHLKGSSLSSFYI